MIKTETLVDGRVHTWSDAGMMIRQDGTGVLYEDAVDTVPHGYTETAEPVPIYEEDATAKDYEAALGTLGVQF